jgi:hypothetical protein
MTLDVLKHRLGKAEAALEQIMASPEYAYAHASVCYGASEHPIFWTVRARADELARCVADLRVQIGGFENDQR